MNNLITGTVVKITVAPFLLINCCAISILNARRALVFHLEGDIS